MPPLKTKKLKQTFSDHVLKVLIDCGVEVPEGKVSNVAQGFVDLFKTYKEPKEPVFWWPELVKSYFDFYAEINNGVKPLFPDTEATGLRRLSLALKKRFKEAHPTEEWTMEIAREKHLAIYKMCCELPWIRSHFSVKYIYDNFDKIVSELTVLWRKQKESGK